MEGSRRICGNWYCLSECMDGSRRISGNWHCLSIVRYMAPPLGGHDLMAEGTVECGMHSNLEDGLFSLIYHPRLAHHVQLVLLELPLE